MTPGTFFFDSEFKFHDGEDGKKIFITIGSDRGITLVVKTTSKSKRYLNDFGCQSDHRFPSFHLAKGCCCLNKPTWIDLGEFYEFNDTDLLQKHFSGQVREALNKSQIQCFEFIVCLFWVNFGLQDHQKLLFLLHSSQLSG